MLNKSKVIQILLTLLLIILFVFAAVIAIIFSQGNTFGDNGQITQSSIIRVNSVPEEVDVFLDGVHVSLSEKKIEWVEPGLRELTISKPGYKSWNKTVKVEAGVVKDIYAQLYPEELSVEALTKTNIDEYLFSDDSNFVYYTVLDSPIVSENGLWRLKLTRGLFEFTENEPVLIATLKEYLAVMQDEDYSIKVSPDNNKLIFEIDSQNILLVYEVNRIDQSVNLYNTLGYIPDNLIWFKGSDSLIVQKVGILYELELSTNQKILVNSNLDSDLIYSISSNFIVYYNVIDKKVYKYKDKLSKLYELNSYELKNDLKAIHTVTGFEDIVMFEYEDNLDYINEDKEFINNLPNISSIYQISSNGRVILFVREDRLFAYYLDNTPDNLSFTAQHNPIEIDMTVVDKIYFKPNNKGIVYTIKDEFNIISIHSLDIDGTNGNLLLEDARIASSLLDISSNSTNIYILLKEEIEQGTFTSNIYKVSLEVQGN